MAAVSRSLFVGVAAGAVAGFAVGGIGGRLAMLVLRLTSPGATGVTSDDGFEIGIVSTQTLGLLLATTVAGALGGLLYVALRWAVPHRLRLPLASLVCATVIGAGVVHEDGVDFVLLEPVALAIALFVALPALYGLAVAALAERWLRGVRVGAPARALRAARVVGPAALVAVATLAAADLAGTVSRLL